MTHIFTFILKRPKNFSKAHGVALCESGCGDALVRERKRYIELEFIRDALHFDHLLENTLQAIGGIDGFEIDEINLNAQY